MRLNDVLNPVAQMTCIRSQCALKHRESPVKSCMFPVPLKLVTMRNMLIVPTELGSVWDASEVI